MTRIAWVVFLVGLFASCSAQKDKVSRNPVNPNEFIFSSQDKYLNGNYVNVHIQYYYLDGCASGDAGSVVINVENDTSFVYHYSPLVGVPVETIGPIYHNVIREVFYFEQKVKDPKIVQCGGIGGGKAIIGDLKINGLFAGEFSYCRTNWNGLSTLLNDLRKSARDDYKKTINLPSANE